MFAVVLSLVIAVPTPDTLVDRYVECIRFYDTSELKLQFREVCESPTRLQGVTIREGTYVVRHDGNALED